jgi:biotin-(acetyl-CoA carboxylase) ligase
LKKQHAAGDLGKQIPIFTERARILMEESKQRELADKLMETVHEKMMLKQNQDELAENYEKLQVTLKKSLRLTEQRSHVKG